MDGMSFYTVLATSLSPATIPAGSDVGLKAMSGYGWVTLDKILQGKELSVSGTSR
jgi:hypothetical protein